MPSIPPSPASVQVLPVFGLPEVREGDDLAGLLADALDAAGGLRDGDVVCVSAKVVSKAAGLRIPPAQKDAAVSAAAVREVARRRHRKVVTRVVQLAHGPVMAAAGIDASNSPDGLLLLPEDPDAEAARLHAALSAESDARIGVVLTDTSSRVWRQGVGDLALGACGVRALEDLRGSADAQGRTMSVTVRALADEIAAAADLVKGKTAGVPVAIVRGVTGAVVDPAAGCAGTRARDLSRTGEDDWFRRPSLESAWQALGLDLEQEPIAAMEPEPPAERIQRAIRVALAERAQGRERTQHRVQTHGRRAQGAVTAVGPDDQLSPVLLGPEDGVIEVRPARPGAPALIAAATLAERLRTALAAEAIADGHESLLGMRVLVGPAVDHDLRQEER